MFPGPVPFSILDHKLGLKPKKSLLLITDCAEELLRTQIFYHKTKKNVVQSYIRYKEHYDKKLIASNIATIHNQKQITNESRP